MRTLYESELKELQGKTFTSVEELEKAEAKVNTEIAKKQEIMAKRKADAEIVDKAIKAEVETKKSVFERKNELTKNYLKAKRELDKKYLSDKNELEQELETAEEKVADALKEFCKNHPEGYHSTIKFDDGSTQTYSYTENKDGISIFDLIETFCDVPFGLF